MRPPGAITLVVNHLCDGGAARVAVQLAGAWAEQGRRVTLLTTDQGLEPSPYTLHPRVSHRPLGLRGDSRHPLEAAWRNLTRVLRLRRALRASHPDLIVSFIDRNNILCLLATRALRPIPILVAERTDPQVRPLGAAWAFLRRLTYPWADGLVTQTRQALAFFPAPVRARGWIIPNPALRPAADSPAPGPRPRPLILTLGRLSWVKGHDQLIEAFALLAGTFPEWDLRIHGEGPEREALQARIHAHGLGHRITLGPAIADVGSCLRDADLFVLPSRAEGFPNALAEAMAWGLPVLSCDCPSGPSDLIRHGVDGLLVPPGDVPALAGAMGTLLGDTALRARLAARAPDVLTRFSPSRVMALWEEALTAACTPSQRRNPS
jgi:glycosyltransferase involved in cell wall biosynthesis